MGQGPLEQFLSLLPEGQVGLKDTGPFQEASRSLED